MTQIELLPREADALRMLYAFTGGGLDFWTLAGPTNAGKRQLIMATLTGRKVPKAKAGINAMRDKFFALLKVEGTLYAYATLDTFVNRAKQIVGTA